MEPALIFHGGIQIGKRSVNVISERFEDLPIAQPRKGGRMIPNDTNEDIVKVPFD
jgi:hypothetical protein